VRVLDRADDLNEWGPHQDRRVEHDPCVDIGLAEDFQLGEAPLA
jgi:hypothetical protein